MPDFIFAQILLPASGPYDGTARFGSWAADGSFLGWNEALFTLQRGDSFESVHVKAADAIRAFHSDPSLRVRFSDSPGEY